MQDMLLPTPAQGKAIRQIAECALQNRAAGFSHRTNQDRFETPASEPTLSASGARIRLRLRCQGKITSSAAAELVSVLRHPITWVGMRHHSTTFSFGQVPNSNKNASAQLYLQPTVLKYRCRNRRPSGRRDRVRAKHVVAEVFLTAISISYSHSPPHPEVQLRSEQRHERRHLGPGPRGAGSRGAKAQKLRASLKPGTCTKPRL